MKRLTFQKLVDSLKKVGLKNGSLVHVQSDLRRIGPVDTDADRNAILNFYYTAIKTVIGKEGTITVPTAFPDFGRFGTTFVRETSPSRLGVFSEYIRTMKGSVRSLHPLASITGIGPHASQICSGNHYIGMGYDSPWGRLHRFNAKILSLGLGPDHLGGTSFFHYIDNMYGVPYLYNKIFSGKVISNNKIVKGPFVMAVRFLQYNIVYDSSTVRHFLIDNDFVKSIRLGSSYLMCGDARIYFNETIKLLNKDIYILLKSAPTFKKGSIPIDLPPGSLIPPDGNGKPAQVISKILLNKYLK